jgi:GAF domain-containing protein
MSAETATILKSLSEAALGGADRHALATSLVTAVARAVPAASWVGVYWLEGDELVLGPYLGPPTDHTRIPVGVGVCGTAVAEDRDQIVDDVRQRPNYLACSARVKSEIVVLIRSAGRVVGQLDLDSERLAAFGPDVHVTLKAAADSFGGLLAGLPAAASGRS